MDTPPEGYAQKVRAPRHGHLEILDRAPNPARSEIHLYGEVHEFPRGTGGPRGVSKQFANLAARSRSDQFRRNRGKNLFECGSVLVSANRESRQRKDQTVLALRKQV